MKRLIILFLCLFLLGTAGAQEPEKTRGKLNIEYDYYGFLTQSAIKTDGNNYFGKSNGKDISFDYRELGLGGSLYFKNNLSLSGLVLSRDAGKTDNHKPSIDFLKVEYENIKAPGGYINLSAGRIKLPFGLFNETRDMATSKPSVMLAQSVYSDHARQYLVHSDGFHINYHLPSKDSRQKLRILLKRSETVGHDNKETEAFFLGADHPGELGSKPGVKLGIEYINYVSGTKLWLEGSKSTITYEPASGDYMPAGEIEIDLYIASISQELGKFTLISELFLPSLYYRGFEPIITDTDSEPLGRYVQVNYKHNAKLEFYARYDERFTDADDRSGENLSAATGRLSHNFFAYDKAIGVLYHPTHNLTLGLEYHDINGTASLPIQDNPNLNGQVKNWKMLLFQASYQF